VQLFHLRCHKTLWAYPDRLVLIHQ
jgi:hypothetical protein